MSSYFSFSSPDRHGAGNAVSMSVSIILGLRLIALLAFVRVAFSRGQCACIGCVFLLLGPCPFLEASLDSFYLRDAVVGSQWERVSFTEFHVLSGLCCGPALAESARDKSSLRSELASCLSWINGVVCDCFSVAAFGCGCFFAV